MFPLPRVGDALLAHCLNCIRLRRACQSIPGRFRVGPEVGSGGSVRRAALHLHGCWNAVLRDRSFAAFESSAVSEWLVIRSELPASMTVRDEKSSGWLLRNPFITRFRLSRRFRADGKRMAHRCTFDREGCDARDASYPGSDRPDKHFSGAQPGSAQAAKRPGYR